MAGDSDLRVLLKLLQISGLAPYKIGKDQKHSKKSFVLFVFNLIFASFILYNIIWAENDSRNNVDYPNKTFLIGIAFDTVDVLENLHISFVSIRSLLSTNIGIAVWFKIKQINQKLNDLDVEFDDRKLKNFIYIKTVIFVILSSLFLTADIILCSQLNIYYTANYWALCALPLLYNSLIEVSFSAFVLILYQRFWVINELLNNYIIYNKKIQTPPKNNPKPPDGKFLLMRLNNLKKNRIRPLEVSTKKKPPCLVMLKNHVTFQRNFRPGMIRSLKILYFDLFDVSVDLNSIFGWNLLFIFVISFFGCTINLYFVIIFHLRSYDTEQYVSCLAWMTAYLFKVVYLIVFSNKAAKQARRTTDLLHVLLGQTDLNDTQLQTELRTFCLQNSQCKVKFKAADFFTLDRSILFQFIAGVLSNVVFVVQFDKINFSTK